MPASADQELSTIDSGDDMQRRLRYQAKYTAWKAICMLDSESEVDSFFCEHHQDLLAKLKRGGFVAIQVKTRILNRDAFKATEPEIINTIAKFIDLESRYPNQIRRFVIASNHGFRSGNNDQSLEMLIDKASNPENDSIPTEVRSYLSRINNASGNQYNEEVLRHVLAKLILEGSLPQFEDFQRIIASEIEERTGYINVPHQVREEAAIALINKIQCMSSLEVDRFPEAVFKPDPKSYEDEAIISNKRITSEIVRAVVQSSITPAQMAPPSAVARQAHTPETFSASSKEKSCESFKRNSRQLLSWPTTLDGSTRLESPNLELLKLATSTQDSSVHLVLGPPGSGKSALLAVLSHEMIRANNIVLALKADQLPANVDTDSTLQEFLGLDFPLHLTVTELAKTNKVFFMLDQLDALADLTCLNPQRLILLLNIIEKCSRIANVHIIASARQFDADYDPHLRALEAERVTLPLPDWEQVAPVLDAQGIGYQTWTEDVRNLLRTPQYLKIFLGLQKVEREGTFQSYRGMLNTLWKLRVEDTDGIHEAVLEEIAQRMSRFEELAVPTSAYSSKRAVIDHLISAGILEESTATATIAFTHQTLFEYTRTRTFLKGSVSLSSYVSERQNSLFIRPQLWNALSFMRDGENGQYRSEVSALIQNPSLRFHLRLLVIEFLGSLAQPNNCETGLLLPLLNNEESRSSVLSSLVGSPGWFEKLANGFLPGYMRRSKEQAAEVLGILRAAINFDKTRTLDLLEQNWMTDPEMDFHTLTVLESMLSWCERSFRLAFAIIERNDVSPVYVGRLCAKVGEQSATWAVRLLLSYLTGASTRAGFKSSESTPDSVSPLVKYDELSTEPGLQDILMDQKSPRRRALIDLLDRDELYLFDELVEANPQLLVETLWPWFVKVVAEIAHQPHQFVNTYPGDGTHTRLDSDDDDDDVITRYSILGALDDAIKRFAVSAPKDYCAFVDQNKEIQYFTIQRLLARGLLETVSSEPECSLTFLTEDMRRMCLGNTSSEHHDSERLITNLYPHLDDDQRSLLESRIRYYSHYTRKPENDDADTRFKRLKWDRQHRLVLLQAIPAEYTSSEASKLRAEEERAFPDLKKGVRGVRSAWIGSPLSIEQMNRASADDLSLLFQELNDSTGSSHPKDWMRGGTVQLSETLVELAKSDKEKVLQLLDGFEPGTNEIAASRALQGLGLSDLDDDFVFKLILDLDRRGFSEASFRAAVAGVVQHKANARIQIPTEIVDLLQRFLREYRGGPPEVILNRDERKKQGSMLWRSRHDEAHSTTSTFTLVEALIDVYLNTVPPDWEKWLQLLENLIERTELSDYALTWRMLSLTQLPNLRMVDHERGNHLLRSLLDYSPSPLVSTTGATLLAFMHGWLSEDIVQQWLDAFRESTWNGGKQAYGELLTLHHIWFPRRDWTRAALDDLFSIHQDRRSSEVVNGVAYTIGHLWSHQENRELKADLLFKLIDYGNAGGCQAISEGLSHSTFPVDDQTKALLKRLAEDRALLCALDTSGVVDNLQELVDWFPESVYRVCLAIVDEFGADIGDIRTSHAVIAGSLIDLGLRLQYQAEPAKGWGLNLLERLIELKIPDARAMLNSLDRRIDATAILSHNSQRLPRRRRRGRRRDSS